MFVKENVNPKEKKVADCVIRAIAKAEGKSWLEIFDTLTAIAREEYTVLNDKGAYGKYLSKYEKINVMYEVGKGSKITVKNGVRTAKEVINRKRLTVNDVCKLKGTYVVSVAGHLTVVIDGNYYDTWDCGDKSSYVIWKVK